MSIGLTPLLRAGHNDCMGFWKKAVLACAAVVSGVVAIALVAVAVRGDLDTADRAASVVGAVVGMAGLVLSLWSLLAGRSEGGVRASGAGAVVAGRSVGRAVTGDRNRLAGPPSPVPAPAAGTAVPSAPVRADGDRSVAAGEAAGDVITGHENTL